MVLKKENLKFLSQAVENPEEVDSALVNVDVSQVVPPTAIERDTGISELVTQALKTNKVKIDYKTKVLKINDNAKTAVKERFNGMMDDMIDTFNDTMSKTKDNYYLNIGISILIIIFGTTLLSISIYRGIFFETFDPLSTIPAALGIGSFAALFFTNPQTKIRRILGDLGQMQMIYTNWSQQAYSAYASLVLEDFTVTAMNTFQKKLAATTKEAVDAIETNIGNDSESSISSEISNKNGNISGGSSATTNPEDSQSTQ
jgi:hypothetical protein